MEGSQLYITNCNLKTCNFMKPENGYRNQRRARWTLIVSGERTVACRDRRFFKQVLWQEKVWISVLDYAGCRAGCPHPELRQSRRKNKIVIACDAREAYNTFWMISRGKARKWRLTQTRDNSAKEQKSNSSCWNTPQKLDLTTAPKIPTLALN